VSFLWPYFWPLLVAGLAIGAAAGTIALRRGRRITVVMIGLVATLACAALWHGPIGAAGRFAQQVDRTSRATLDYYEMTQVTGRLQRQPLSRDLMLAGPADDFQRGEIQRVLGDVPGVRAARWSPPRVSIPLFVEGALAAIAGFLAGLLLAYVVEARRRYNAQWNW
jgi:hypothetical protein